MRIWGDPVYYKGITVYPVQMEYCESFYESVQCLTYEKNSIQDIRVIKMSYLDFLFALIIQENSIFDKLNQLLRLVLKEQEYEFKYSDDGRIFISIKEIDFNGFEFDNIKNIILDENGIPNEEILDSEMEQEMRRLEEYKSRENGIPATLEERITALHCLSGIPYKDIKEYTIFQFNKTLERFAIIKNFDVYSALLAENGASKDIQHWLSHCDEKGRFANLAMSQEEFNKITSIGKPD